VGLAGLAAPLPSGTLACAPAPALLPVNSALRDPLD